MITQSLCAKIHGYDHWNDEIGKSLNKLTTGCETNSQLREHNYIGASVDGTWRLDLEEPIPLDLPVSEQVELLYRYGYMGEANQALANQYGFDDSTEVIGFRLQEFLPRDLPSSIPLLIRIAELNYSAQQWESVEQDPSVPM